MRWEVKLWVSGSTFIEEVIAKEKEKKAAK